jgi:hypothetical protein
MHHRPLFSAAVLAGLFALAACTAPQTPPETLTAPPVLPSPVASVVPTATPAPFPTATLAPTPTNAPTVPAALSPAAPTATAAPAPTAVGEEILFLRNRALIAFSPQSRVERTLAADVRDFAASPDGALLALVRDAGGPDLWLVQRDGNGLRQLTSDGAARTEATPSWAPDGLSLVYASATGDEPYPQSWPAWGAWCAASVVLVRDLPLDAAREIGAGCDPAFAPDGRRIVFAAPPTEPEPGLANTPATVNSIRLVNRQGENGWNFAQAQGDDAQGQATGRLVYAPSWSPDAQQIAYQRFIGQQVEVDINLSEIGASLEGKGQPFVFGAGWLRPAQFAPDGRTVAVTEYNFSDARGFGGYDEWSIEVIALTGSRLVALPSGEITMLGQPLGNGRLPRAQGVAWSPDGTALAVQLPAGWRPGLPNDEPFDPNGAEEAGEIWRWEPTDAPDTRLATDVDFASPLAWLPAPPLIETSDQGYRLAYPPTWQLAGPSEFEERTAIASDGLRLVSAAPYQQLTAEQAGQEPVERMFSYFVATVETAGDPITWPDGSVYREYVGADLEGRPVAGAVRVVPGAGGDTIIALYRTTPEQWPLERAQAQGLLAGSGPMK